MIIVNGWKPLTIITKSSTLDVAAILDPPLRTSITFVNPLVGFYSVIHVSQLIENCAKFHKFYQPLLLSTLNMPFFAAKDLVNILLFKIVTETERRNAIFVQ